MSRMNVFFISQSLVILAYIALITFLPSLHFMPKIIGYYHDDQRLLEVILLGLVLLDGLINGLHIRKQDKNNVIHIDNKLRIAFFCLLALAISSAFLAQSPRHAVIEISTFIALCYLALFVARLYHQNKELLIKNLSYVLWASIVLYMVTFYVGYITAAVYKLPVRWPLPFSGFSNIRSFNQYQLWTLGLISLPLLGFVLKNNMRKWLHIALALWWILLFHAASRGVLVAWFIALLITGLVYHKSAWSFIRLQLTQMITGFAGFYILFKIMPILLKTSIVTGTVLRATTEDRIYLWSQAFALVKTFPLLGAGPMHYAWYSSTNAHPHNSLLQLAAEWGLPATLVMMSIASYGIYCWLKRFNFTELKTESKLDSNLTVILFFTLTANAVYSLVDGVIVMPISQVLMFTIIGLMIGHYTYGQLVANGRKPVNRPFFAGIVLIAMTWSTLPEIIQGLSGNEKGFSMGYVAQGPRFWREIR